MVDNCILDEMNTDLMKAVTVDEIKKAIFDLESLKSPGPDCSRKTYVVTRGSN